MGHDLSIVRSNNDVKDQSAICREIEPWGDIERHIILTSLAAGCQSHRVGNRLECKSNFHTLRIQEDMDAHSVPISIK